MIGLISIENKLMQTKITLCYFTYLFHVIARRHDSPAKTETNDCQGRKNGAEKKQNKVDENEKSPTQEKK